MADDLLTDRKTGERWNVPPPVPFHRKAKPANYGMYAPSGPSLAHDVSNAPNGGMSCLCIASSLRSCPLHPQDDLSSIYDTVLTELLNPVEDNLEMLVNHIEKSKTVKGVPRLN